MALVPQPQTEPGTVHSPSLGLRVICTQESVLYFRLVLRCGPGRIRIPKSPAVTTVLRTSKGYALSRKGYPGARSGCPSTADLSQQAFYFFQILNFFANFATSARTRYGREAAFCSNGLKFLGGDGQFSKCRNFHPSETE